VQDLTVRKVSSIQGNVHCKYALFVPIFLRINASYWYSRPPDSTDANFETHNTLLPHFVE